MACASSQAVNCERRHSYIQNRFSKKWANIRLLHLFTGELCEQLRGKEGKHSSPAATSADALKPALTGTHSQGSSSQEAFTNFFPKSFSTRKLFPSYSCFCLRQSISLIGFTFFFRLYTMSESNVTGPVHFPSLLIISKFLRADTVA